MGKPQIYASTKIAVIFVATGGAHRTSMMQLRHDVRIVVYGAKLPHWLLAGCKQPVLCPDCVLYRAHLHRPRTR